MIKGMEGLGRGEGKSTSAGAYFSFQGRVFSPFAFDTIRLLL